MYAAGDRDFGETGFLQPVADRYRGNLFQDALVRGGHIAFGKSPSKGADEEGVQTGADADIAVLALEALEKDLTQVLWVAVCRETNDLSLVAHRFEAQAAGHLLVEVAQRVREIKAMQQLNAIGAAGVDAAAGAGAVAVEC